jgi:hypothetical protein
MAEFETIIEALENRVMRSWMRGDGSDIKKLVSRDFIFMFGTTPPALLDRPSFLAAIGNKTGGGLSCTGFRFRELVSRRHGKAVWFTCRAELEMSLGGREWHGDFLQTDLWRKPALGRSWKLAERSLAPLENEVRFSDNIRRLQLWH